MNPTRMAEKPMFPTHRSNPSDGEPDAVKVARPVRGGGMAQTSRSSPAIGGAVPTQCHSIKKSRYTAGQIAFALRQAEGGAPVLEVCRKMGAQTSTRKRGDRGA